MLDLKDFVIEANGNDEWILTEFVLTKVRTLKWKGEYLLDKLAKRFSINFKLLKEEELTKINAEIKKLREEISSLLNKPNFVNDPRYKALFKKKRNLVKWKVKMN